MNYTDIAYPKYADRGLAWAEMQHDRQEPPEPEPILHCSKCGDDICEGEIYFHLDEGDVCENCLSLYYKRYAEWEEK